MVEGAADPKLSQIRRVTVHYAEGSPFEQLPSYLIPEREVAKFVEATKRLHFDPGVNPHNRQQTRKIWKITVARLQLMGPFWWTTPNLQENDDPAGAHTIDSYHEETVFIDMVSVKRWRAEEEAAEAEDHD